MKRVVWTEAQIHKPIRKAGTYGSYKELVAKQADLRKEQEEAEAYLHKAFPYMLQLLEHRLANGHPLTVMRPFRYQTSELASKQNEEDDGFYNTRKSESFNDKFVDVVKVINPGTQLVLKGIDPTLQEFIFKDALEKEYVMSFAERNNIMTQTDIFETVRTFLENKSE
jgi:hypothetical protein